jgi:two-component system, NtrC family, sensor kinase
MMNFSNLTTRLLCVLLLVFLVFLAMVYWIIDQQAKPNVAKLTSQTIIETGNEAVNGILSRVSQIDGMAVTASRMTGSLPKNADIINTSVGNLMANMAHLGRNALALFGRCYRKAMGIFKTVTLVNIWIQI